MALISPLDNRSDKSQAFLIKHISEGERVPSVDLANPFVSVVPQPHSHAEESDTDKT